MREQIKHVLINKWPLSLSSQAYCYYCHHVGMSRAEEITEEGNYHIYE